MNENLEKQKFFVKLFMLGFFFVILLKIFETGLLSGWW